MTEELQQAWAAFLSERDEDGEILPATLARLVIRIAETESEASTGYLVQETIDRLIGNGFG